MIDIRTAILGLLQDSQERRGNIERAISKIGISQEKVSEKIEEMLEDGELYNPEYGVIERTK